MWVKRLKNIKLTPKAKNIIGIILTIVIIFFVYKAFKGLDWRKVLKMEINWGFIVISVVIYALSNHAKALVYTKKLASDMTFLESVSVVSIVNALNKVLPFRAGEGIRLSLFPERYSMGSRLAFLLVPSIHDFLAAIVFAILSVVFCNFNKEVIRDVYLIFIIILFALVFGTMLAATLINKYNEAGKRIFSTDFFGVFLYNFLSWIVMYISMIFCLIALGFEPIDSLTYGLMVMTVTNMVLFVPATPGSIGLFESAVSIGFAQMGLDPAVGAVSGIVLHAVQYIATLPVALYYYLRVKSNKILKLKADQQEK